MRIFRVQLLKILQWKSTTVRRWWAQLILILEGKTFLLPTWVWMVGRPANELTVERVTGEKTKGGSTQYWVTCWRVKVCIPAEQKGEFRASKDRRLWCASLHSFGGMSWYPRSVTPDERPLSWGKAPWQLAHETGFSQIWEVRIRFLFCTCCWVFGPFRDLRFDDVQSIFTYLIWFAHLIWFFRYTTQVKYHYSHFTGKETEIKRG